MKDELDSAEEAYECAEAAFLEHVRRAGDPSDLASASRAVADAAARWNEIAYRRFHAATSDLRQDLDLLTERTEVLRELWADLASAYEARRSR